LRFGLPPLTVRFGDFGPVEAAAEATLFDFGAVSVALRIPFRQSTAALTRLAGQLAEPEALLSVIHQAVEPLYTKLLSAIDAPEWSELSEEYFVFQIPRGPPLPPPRVLLHAHGAWLASLLRLEAATLSDEEIAESQRLHICYTPDDLCVLEWSAAVLIDDDCEQTLQAIEFANLQLLEFRHIDDRLDQRLAEASSLIHPLAQTWLPFWRTHTRPLRALGELKIEANDLFERTSNILKLVGDQYLARVYRQLAWRFHLDDWAQSIQRTLHVIEGVYQVLSDQAATYRTELLEIVIILLIAFEIVMALIGRT
jgi:hypothetical protein